MSVMVSVLFESGLGSFRLVSVSVMVLVLVLVLVLRFGLGSVLGLVMFLFSLFFGGLLISGLVGNPC